MLASSDLRSTQTTTEPTFADALYELRCLLRWGRGRWGFALLLSLVAGLAVGAVVARRPPAFSSTVTIEVKASRGFTDGPPPSARELTQFIMGVALADSQLIALATRLGYDLGPNRDGKPADLAKFRDRTALFVYYDSSHGVLQTDTRIGLRFTAEEPDRALKGARLLAEHVVAFQNHNRMDGNDLERELAHETELGLSTRLSQVESEVARLKAENSFQTRPRTESVARIATLNNESHRLRELLADASTRTRQSVLRGDLERDASGLGYAIADAGTLAPPSTFAPRDKAILIGALCGAAAFPLFILLLGAASFRVYDDDSLRRLGLRSFGHAFVARPGVGSVLERRSVKRGVDRV